jgi:integrase
MDGLLAAYFGSRIGLRSGSRLQYEIACRHWTAFFGDLDPAQCCLRLPEFAANLLLSRKPASVNKTMRHVLAVLRHAGMTPCWKPLPEPWRAPVAFLAPEFMAALKAAEREPGLLCGIPAGDWWRSLLLAVWYSGARIGGCVAVETRDVLLDRGGFYVRAEFQKQRADQFFMVGEDAVAAFRKVWDAGRRLMWPWPYRREALYRTFRRICGRGGVTLGRGPGSCFHRIRKSTASYMKAGGGDPTSQLGHSCSQVTQRYFDPRIVGSHDSRRFMPALG